MKPWKDLLAERPGDDEKRMIIVLTRKLARETGKKPAEVYEAMQRAAKRLRRRQPQ